MLVTSTTVTKGKLQEYIVRALSSGAKGYLLKDSADADLLKAVRTVAAGKPFFSPAIRTRC